ncbi:MAG: hypothetical protein AAF212_03905 [Verrucomicrobiota bacterium]
MRNLILFATYWNERQWIEASLEQIEAIDPIEVIICDGRFDDRQLNRSTDGTREIIQEWIEQRGPNARMISATRLSRLEAPRALLSTISRKGFRPKPARIFKATRQALSKSLYRINQAVTFGKMIQISEMWEPGRWFMTYDADQFYSDDCIATFDQCQSNTDAGLISACEYTFESDFLSAVTGFEKRDWNNMPHKIFPNTAIYPTRHLMLEHPFSLNLYRNQVRAIDGGYYCHYKFRLDTDREKAGYSLGDRRPPKAEKFRDPKKFELEHPQTIKNRFAAQL